MQRLGEGQGKGKEGQAENLERDGRKFARQAAILVQQLVVALARVQQLTLHLARASDSIFELRRPHGRRTRSAATARGQVQKGARRAPRARAARVRPGGRPR